jgi:hypothetical protein
MIQGRNETDSPERTLKVGLLAMLAGAAALAVLLVGLAAGSTGVHAQEAGATYTGAVDVLVEGQCGGGTISLTVSEDGSSVTQLVLDGTYVGSVFVNSLADPAGPFVVPLDPGIAIGADGSFSETIQPVAGIDADIEGQFDGDAVSGTFGVVALDCVDVPFSAEVGAAAPAPTATVTLPTTGSASAGSGDSTGLWAALAAAAGAVMLAGGLLALRRRA